MEIHVFPVELIKIREPLHMSVSVGCAARLISALHRGGLRGQQEGQQRLGAGGGAKLMPVFFFYFDRSANWILTS